MESRIIDMNRRAINSIGNWIDPVDYEHSFSHYGCPEYLLPLLNRPINRELIYTDFMVYAARRAGFPVSYLEIGVSVGKNFFAIADGLENSEIYGLDWERFNPSIESCFTLLNATDNIRSYTNGKNDLHYAQGDIFDETSWQKLQGNKFQIIFSDASHHPHALLHEFEMLRRYQLLDPKRLFIIWDDLDRDYSGSMTQAFFHIARQLQALYGTDDRSCFPTAVNGWLGEHEHKHTVGIFNTMNISEDDLLSIK